MDYWSAQCDVAAAQAKLDEATYQAAWTAGRTMTLEEATADVLRRIAAAPTGG
jgi:hypothetical protein